MVYIPFNIVLNHIFIELSGLNKWAEFCEFFQILISAAMHIFVVSRFKVSSSGSNIMLFFVIIVTVALYMKRLERHLPSTGRELLILQLQVVSFIFWFLLSSMILRFDLVILYSAYMNNLFWLSFCWEFYLFVFREFNNFKKLFFCFGLLCCAKRGVVV